MLRGDESQTSPSVRGVCEKLPSTRVQNGGGRAGAEGGICGWDNAVRRMETVPAGFNPYPRNSPGTVMRVQVTVKSRRV